MADYRLLRDVMWSDRVYRLRELPEYHGFPMIIKVVSSGKESQHTPKFTAGEMLRLDGVERQRRIIAVDSRSRHWSFPVHIGAKFDIKDKKGRRSSMYMSEMVGDSKLPKNLKKFRFAEKDVMQLKINGEDHKTSSGPIIEGDFQCKDVIRIGIFKANRITEVEVNPHVLFLPAYMDMEVTVATMISGEPGAFWEEYMDAMTSDIKTKINLDMYRGKSEILIYEFPKKRSRPKSVSCLYEAQVPTMIVTIGGIMKKRPVSRVPPVRTTETPDQVQDVTETEGAEEEEQNEPKETPMETLRNSLYIDDEGLTDDELRVAKHRRMLLMMLEQEEERETDGIPQPWQQREAGGVDSRVETAEQAEGGGDDEDGDYYDEGEEDDLDADSSRYYNEFIRDSEYSEKVEDGNDEGSYSGSYTNSDDLFGEAETASPARGEGDGLGVDNSADSDLPIDAEQAAASTSLPTSSSSLSISDAQEQDPEVNLDVPKDEGTLNVKDGSADTDNSTVVPTVESATKDELTSEYVDASKATDASALDRGPLILNTANVDKAPALLQETSEAKMISTPSQKTQKVDEVSISSQPLSMEEIAKKPRSPGDGSPVPSFAPESNVTTGAQNSPQRRVPPRIPLRVDSRLSLGIINPVMPVSRSVSVDVSDSINQCPVQPRQRASTATNMSKPQPKPRKNVSMAPRPAPRARANTYGSRGKAHTTMTTDTRHASMRFERITDFPEDLVGLTIDDMCAALCLLNLGEYEGSIQEQNIDGEMAKELSEDMMKADLGMSGLAAKKWMRFIHHNWRPM